MLGRLVLGVTNRYSADGTYCYNGLSVISEAWQKQGPPIVPWLATSYLYEEGYQRINDRQPSFVWVSHQKKWSYRSSC